jgi:hypothetical protein
MKKFFVLVGIVLFLSGLAVSAEKTTITKVERVFLCGPEHFMFLVRDSDNSLCISEYKFSYDNAFRVRIYDNVEKGAKMWIKEVRGSGFLGGLKSFEIHVHSVADIEGGTNIRSVGKSTVKEQVNIIE